MIINQTLLNKTYICFQNLLDKKLRITIAESCTGGLLSFLFASIANASKVLDCSFVTYSNESKHNILNVSNETLQNYGAVSSQTAIEMSRGALKYSNANLAIAITGIAGPGGYSTKKTVGLVYISCVSQDNEIIVCNQYNFPFNERNKIQLESANAAIDLILDKITNNKN